MAMDDHFRIPSDLHLLSYTSHLVSKPPFRGKSSFPTHIYDVPFQRFRVMIQTNILNPTLGTS